MSCELRRQKQNEIPELLVIIILLLSYRYAYSKELTHHDSFETDFVKNIGCKIIWMWYTYYIEIIFIIILIQMWYFNEFVIYDYSKFLTGECQTFDENLNEMLFWNSYAFNLIFYKRSYQSYCCHFSSCEGTLLFFKQVIGTCQVWMNDDDEEFWILSPIEDFYMGTRSIYTKLNTDLVLKVPVICIVHCLLWRRMPWMHGL